MEEKAEVIAGAEKSKKEKGGILVTAVHASGAWVLGM